jgi:hypothetical protein
VLRFLVDQECVEKHSGKPAQPPTGGAARAGAPASYTRGTPFTGMQGVLTCQPSNRMAAKLQDGVRCMMQCNLESATWRQPEWSRAGFPTLTDVAPLSGDDLFRV